MAVKKAPAKKSVAKKSAPKKSAPKKAVAKKAVAKKAVAKKAPAKKSAPKKAVAKKAVARKAAPKKPVAKKSVTKKPLNNFVIPEPPITSVRSIPVAPAVGVMPVVFSPVAAVPSPIKKPGASRRVLLALTLGIVLIALVVWSKSGGDETKETAQPTPTPTTTISNSPTVEPTEGATDEPATTSTPSESPNPEAVVSAHEAPRSAVGNYTSNGLRLTWKAPAASEGLTGYNIEISRSGGAYEMFSTLPATQLSLILMKDSESGWTTFRISSVYSDDVTVAVKAFGFPGQFS